MSLTPGSRSNGSSGPNPNTSSTTSPRMTSRSLMLSGVPSSAIRSNSSVRISASARCRSADASASRLSRLSSLRWTFALSSRYCGRGASTRGGRGAPAGGCGTFMTDIVSVPYPRPGLEQAEKRAPLRLRLLGLGLRVLVQADQVAREVAELRRDLRVIRQRQRHPRVERGRHRAVVARERVVDAVAERGLDLLGRDQVLVRHPVQQDLHALAPGAELPHAI